MASVRAKDNFIMILGIFVFIISIGGAFVLGSYTPEGKKEVPKGNDLVDASYTAVFDSTLTEGSSEPQDIVLAEKKVSQVVMSLTWQDEPSASRHTNTPDTFKLEAASEFGTDSKEDASGSIQIVFKAPEDGPWNMEDRSWNVTITAVDCGDQEPLVPDPLGFRTIVDGGNSYHLEVEITYKTKKTTE